MDRLRTALSKTGRRIHDVPRDGNCQFHAVAHQVRHLRRDQGVPLPPVFEQHTSLRRLCLAYLNTDRPFRDLTREVGFQPKRMARNGEFGNEVTLRAMAGMLGVRILVVQPDWHVWIQEPGVSCALPVMVLGHLPEHHYVSTLPF